MRIEHLAIWVQDLEGMKSFYRSYFGAKAGEKYRNDKKNFESYFLSFDSGCRLELMNRPDIHALSLKPGEQFQGIIHFAISVGSKEEVDLLTERLRTDGYKVIEGPRTTGDGYYESVVLDPENNRIEVTI